jgi:hypothetical protein
MEYFGKLLYASVRAPGPREIVIVLFLILLGVGVVVQHEGAVSEQRIISACNGSVACFKNIVLNDISRHGLTSGFELVGTIYKDTPSFRGNCSNFTLDLTQALYTKYPDYTRLQLSPEVVWCNYGLLQQYPQSLLLATKNIQQAKGFCEYVADSIGNSVPGAEAECYRGIGRGLPFIDPASAGNPERMAVFALQQCKELTSDPSDYGTCLSGLFNIIGRSEVAGQFGLSLDSADPMYLCKIQTDEEARNRCFGNYKATVISMVDVADTTAAQKKIMALYGPDASSSTDDAIWTLGYEWARTKLVMGEPFEPAIDACRALSVPFMRDCIQGISVGLAKHGIPEEQHVLMTAFCKAARTAIPMLVPADCPSLQAVGYIRGFYSPAAFKSAYAYMQKELGGVISLDGPAGYGF